MPSQEKPDWCLPAKADSMEEESTALLKFNQQITCRHRSSHGEQPYRICLASYTKHGSSVTRGTFCPLRHILPLTMSLTQAAEVPRLTVLGLPFSMTQPELMALWGLW